MTKKLKLRYNKPMSDIIPTVYQFRIFCITESEWVYCWGTDPPTTCPNDASHDVNPFSVQVEQTISPNTVSINNEPAHSTGGFYRTVGYMRNIPLGNTGDVHVFDVSYEYPINLQIVNIRCDDNAFGDMIVADIAPDTVIGVITESVSTGSTVVLPVSSSVIQNAPIGIHINVLGSSGVYDLGVCTLLGTTSDIISVSELPTGDLNPGDLVRMSFRNIDSYYVSNNLDRVFGSGKIGANYIPAGTTMRISYHNNNGQAKSFFLDNEFFY